MRIFCEKNCKIRLSVESSAPESPLPRCLRQTSALLLPPAITTLSSLFLVLNAFFRSNKNQVTTANACSALTSSALLHLFF